MEILGAVTGAVNGHSNGHANGASNGAVNGVTNGSSNGSEHGVANGSHNGNGTANGNGHPAATNIYATVKGPLGIESASLRGKVALVTGSGKSMQVNKKVFNPC